MNMIEMNRIRKWVEFRWFVAIFVAATSTATLGCTPRVTPVATTAPPVAEEPEETAATEEQVPVAPPREQAEWTSLFDGESLGNWTPTQFGGEGEVTVEEG